LSAWATILEGEEEKEQAVAFTKRDVVLILNCGITQCTRNISCVTLVLPQ